jgi:hypothetical protein
VCSACAGNGELAFTVTFPSALSPRIPALELLRHCVGEVLICFVCFVRFAAVATVCPGLISACYGIFVYKEIQVRIRCLLCQCVCTPAFCSRSPPSRVLRARVSVCDSPAAIALALLCSPSCRVACRARDGLTACVLCLCCLSVQGRRNYGFLLAATAFALVGVALITLSKVLSAE